MCKNKGVGCPEISSNSPRSRIGGWAALVKHVAQKLNWDWTGKGLGELIHIAEDHDLKLDKLTQY